MNTVSTSPLTFWSKLQIGLFVLLLPIHNVFYEGWFGISIKPIIGFTILLLVFLIMRSCISLKSAMILPPRRFLLAFWALLIFALLSIFGARDPARSYQLIGALLFAFSITLVTLNLIRNREHLKFLLKAIIMVGFTMGLTGMFFYFSYLTQGHITITGERLPFMTIYVGHDWVPRLTGWHLDPNFYATYLSLFLALIIPGLVERYVADKYRWLGWMAVALIIINLILTFSRTAWVLTIILILYMLNRYGGGKLLSLRFSKPALRLCGGLLVIFILGFALFSLLIPKELLVERWNLFVQVFQNPFSESTTARWNAYIASLTLGMDHPIWGVGLGNTVLYEPYFHGPIQYAHNIWIELFCELGLFGVLVYGYLIFMVIATALRVQKAKIFELRVLGNGVFAGMIILQLYWLFLSGLYEVNTWFLMGFVFALDRLRIFSSSKTCQTGGILRNADRN